MGKVILEVTYSEDTNCTKIAGHVRKIYGVSDCHIAEVKQQFYKVGSIEV